MAMITGVYWRVAGNPTEAARYRLFDINKQIFLKQPHWLFHNDFCPEIIKLLFL